MLNIFISTRFLAFERLQSLGIHGQWTKERRSQLTVLALQPMDSLISSGVVLDCMSD